MVMLGSSITNGFVKALFDVMTVSTYVKVGYKFAS
jgi:hypothetical protein